MKLRRLLISGAAALAIALPGLAAAKEEMLHLVAPIADYKLYVAENTEKLVADTEAFVAAVKTGNVEKARALFAPTRISYERIEPIAELFSDLDVSIDARADDFEKAEKDPAFSGFHRIEHALWDANSTKGMEPYADKLLADVKDLHKRIDGLVFPPKVVIGGAAVLMEEVAATKISGEEDRYSHTDLWDFRGNFDGSKKIFDLVEPLVSKQDPAFVKKVADNFARVDATLDKYKTAKGYEPYDKLTDSDRTVLAAAVNTLAEDLSTLRGKLGVD
ncbi:iron uptake system protein EfeO [Oleispirillum naphthae]|uniref:iron uptake system protein EfeO n=1 Tax=Oleispirillum naphthae TaxID=2838853 RepID=UPI0030824A3B